MADRDAAERFAAERAHSAHSSRRQLHAPSASDTRNPDAAWGGRALCGWVAVRRCVVRGAAETLEKKVSAQHIIIIVRWNALLESGRRATRRWGRAFDRRVYAYYISLGGYFECRLCVRATTARLVATVWMDARRRPITM